MLLPSTFRGRIPELPATLFKQKDGKLPSQSLAEAEVTGALQQTRPFLTDRSTGRPLLVDTGADVSVFPPTKNQKCHPTTIQLYAANGTPISIDNFQMGFYNR